MTKHKKTNHHLHAIRIVLFGILLIAAVLPRFNGHSLPVIAAHDTRGVLAYATSMSRNELLEQNNLARRTNGLPPFILNAALNSSAQAKAQHMADNNYWAHAAPDGTQPWYFFEAAGYSYAKAGENLAYGFESAYSTNQGWLNSPGHKANIMGDYTEVGYGFVNSSKFQGSENTIVVAHYAKPLVYVAPTATTEPVAPPPSPAPVPAPSKPQSPQPSPQKPTPAVPATQQSAPQEKHPDVVKPVAVASAKEVNILESIKNGSMPSVAMLSLGLTMSTAIGYAFTHRSLMKHAVAIGERYLISHPLLDIAALAVALVLILTATAAHLQ